MGVLGTSTNRLIDANRRAATEYCRTDRQCHPRRLRRLLPPPNGRSKVAVPPVRAWAPTAPPRSIEQLEQEIARSPRSARRRRRGGIVDLNDERVLQEVGIYRYHHPVENSEEYRDRLRDLQEQVKSICERSASDPRIGHVHLQRVAGQGPQDDGATSPS